MQCPEKTVGGEVIIAEFPVVEVCFYDTAKNVHTRVKYEEIYPFLK